MTYLSISCTSLHEVAAKKESKLSRKYIYCEQYEFTESRTRFGVALAIIYLFFLFTQGGRHGRLEEGPSS